MDYLFSVLFCFYSVRHSPRSLAVCESASPQVCSCMFPCVFSYALSCFSPPFALFELMVTLICFVLFFSSNAVPSISVAAHTTDVCIWCIRTLISLLFFLSEVVRGASVSMRTLLSFPLSRMLSEPFAKRDNFF